MQLHCPRCLWICTMYSMHNVQNNLYYDPSCRWLCNSPQCLIYTATLILNNLSVNRICHLIVALMSWSASYAGRVLLFLWNSTRFAEGSEKLTCVRIYLHIFLKLGIEKSESFYTVIPYIKNICSKLKHILLFLHHKRLHWSLLQRSVI